ncbi:MAG: sulfocyanin-like copper-binding protein [Ilumatobacteraceae bacterium]
MGTATKKPDPSRASAYPSRRAQRYEQRKARTRNRVIAVFSAMFLIAGVVLIVSIASGGGDTTSTTAPYVGSTLDVVLGDYVILGDLTAPAGNVRLQAVNQGGIIHNVGIRRGPISGDIQPGKSFTIGLGSLAAGTYQLYCDLPGHVEQGMIADLVVT